MYGSFVYLCIAIIMRMYYIYIALCYIYYVIRYIYIYLCCLSPFPALTHTSTLHTCLWQSTGEGVTRRHLLYLFFLPTFPFPPPRRGASLSPTTSTDDPVTPPTYPIPSMHRRESITVEREPGTDSSTLSIQSRRDTNMAATAD